MRSGVMHALGVLFVFFLMIRRPPRSTLFPTRRSSDLSSAATSARTCAHGTPEPPSPAMRSEEHTSELQSLRHLVCRLLLEKKEHNRTATNWKRYAYIASPLTNADTWL